MAFFKKIFSSKADLLPYDVDLSKVHTDMHSHFIPGIDDGCENLEESIELIRQMQQLGFKKLICTPHVMTDYYKNDQETIKRGHDQLVHALHDANIQMALDYAAEYRVDEGFMELVKHKDLLTINGQYVLIELSFFYPPDNLKQIIFDLQIAGYKVILAHPERYAYWHRDFEKYEELKEREVYFQINTISLSGHYSEEVKRIAGKLIDNDMVDFIGSDMHHQNYLDSLKHSLNEPMLERIVDSRNLLNPTL